MMAREKAGRSSGFRLVIRLPSQTTSSSTQAAPAFVTPSGPLPLVCGWVNQAVKKQVVAGRLRRDGRITAQRILCQPSAGDIGIRAAARASPTSPAELVHAQPLQVRLLHRFA